jgi:DNA-directed RNA polymerase specialized sigma24 family protein
LGRPVSNSVTQWIANLQKGDADAAQRLWDRYFEELVKFARERLGATPRQARDEEDLALSVFDSFFRGARAGRLAGLKHRHELWWMLLAITRRKVVDQFRGNNRQKHGVMVTRIETDVGIDPKTNERFDLNLVLDETPSPDLLLQLDEEWQRLLSLLRDDTLRRIACWRIEGYSVLEIAAKLQVLPRTVGRKLSLIRSKWAEEIGPEIGTEP